MKVANVAGSDAVKIHKRTPAIWVLAEQQEVMRKTPWVMMTYIDYWERIDLDGEYRAIDTAGRKFDMVGFGSPWDVPSEVFLEQFGTMCHTITSVWVTL